MFQILNLETSELIQVLLTDGTGNKLYGRIMFINGELKDFTEDWWRSDELQSIKEKNYLKNDKGEYCGIQVLNSMTTKYGNTYQIAWAKTNLISPFLKYNIKHEYYQTLFKNFKGVSKNGYKKFSEDPFLNFYKISDEIKEEAEINLNNINLLIEQILSTKGAPEVLNIEDRLLESINAHLECGQVRLGPNKKKLLELFTKFFGNLRGNDYDRNYLLYKVCFNDVRNDYTKFTVDQLIIRKQDMKQWYRAVLEMFKQCDTSGNDPTDILIRKSGISQETSFTPNYEDSPTEADVKLTEILKNLVVTIFGRYTYIAMITGSIFVIDNEVRFIRHPWQSFTKAANDNKLSFLHDSIPSTRLDRMLKRSGSLSRAKQVLLDLITLGPQIEIQMGPNPKSDVRKYDVPTIPMILWMPIYKEVFEIKPEDRKSFYELLSYMAARELGFAAHRDVEEFSSRSSGNIKLYKILCDLYKNKIESKTEISDHQKTMYYFLMLESLNNFIFASKSSTDVNKREKIRIFLESEGKDSTKWFDLDITVNTRDFPIELKTLALNREVFDKFFVDESYLEIINSLIPAKITNIEEYNIENILRAQMDPIIGFSNFFRNLAEKYAKEDKVIEIQAFHTYSSGLAYSKRSNVRYLSFFPDAENPNNPQKFILDGKNLEDFKASYKKMLGGLLVDHQTYIISARDGQGNIQYLCAFNLLFGAINIENYIPRPKTIDYVSAPEIKFFDESLYDEADPNNIIHIMNAFRENDGLIGYQRYGASMSEERRNEMILWDSTCTKLYYIEYAF